MTKVCFNWSNDVCSTRIGGLQLQFKTKATIPTLVICGCTPSESTGKIILIVMISFQSQWLKVQRNYNRTNKYVSMLIQSFLSSFSSCINYKFAGAQFSITSVALMEYTIRRDFFRQFALISSSFTPLHHHSGFLHLVHLSQAVKMYQHSGFKACGGLCSKS